MDEALKAKLLDALRDVAWDKLTDDQRLDLLRIYAILFVPHGPAGRRGTRKGHHQTSIRISRPRIASLNADLCQLLVYLEAPKVVERDAETAGRGADAGRADGVRQVVACAEDRLDDGAAQDVFLLVS